MKIYAYGDSFVAGDQDIPGRVDAIEENMDYNRYNVSFASVLAKKLNATLINRAISGCSNIVQLDQLWVDSENIKTDDLVLFGFTSAARDRFMIPYEDKSSILDKTRGPRILNWNLFKDNTARIIISDFFYVLSVIEKLEKLYNFKVIKFNNFHNPFIDDISTNDFYKFKFDNFIGLHTPGNTLLDVLSDNWGNTESKIFDHNKWKPQVNKHLFTVKSHPSVQGHIKIAEWLHQQLIINNWL